MFVSSTGWWYGHVCWMQCIVLEKKPSNLRIRDVNSLSCQSQTLCWRLNGFVITALCYLHLQKLFAKRLTAIHTLMAVAAMQDDNQHIGSSLGFSILPKDNLTCRPGELNQQPSNKKTLAVTPEPQPPYFSLCTTREESGERKHCDLSPLNIDWWCGFYLFSCFGVSPVRPPSSIQR